MTTQKIVSGNGFNEGGAVISSTGSGVFASLSSDALVRSNLPQDYSMYGIVEHAVISAGAVTQLLRAGVPGRQIEVMSYAFVCDDTTLVTFKSGTTAISGSFAIATNGGISSPATDNEAIMTTAIGEDLNITNTVGNIAGHITYRIV